MTRVICGLLLALNLGLSSVATADTQTSPPTAPKDRHFGRWSLGCAARGCFIFLDDAYAGNNTVEVGIDRKTKRPVLFGFVTDGDADQGKGLIVTFAKTTTHAERPECGGGPDAAKPADCYDIKIDPESTFSIPLTDCDASTCVGQGTGSISQGCRER